MTIKVGDRIPSVNLKKMGEKGPENISTDEIFNGKKVVLFSVPGAFTPTCSAAHLPGYVAVNDAFVMGAWGKAQNADELLMLADGNAEFAQALGLTLDGSGFGLGTRSQRFALVAENGVVKHLAVEPGPGLDVSAAEKIMEVL